MKNRNRFATKIFQLLLIPVICLLTGISILQINNINFSLRSADLKFYQQQYERNNQTFPVLYCPEAPLLIQTGTEKFRKDEEQIDKDWYSTVMENIKNDEYNISFDDQTGSYQSPNRANNIRFIYHNDGFTAKTRSTKIPKFDASDRTLKEEEKKYETIDEWNIQFRIKNEDFKIGGDLCASGNKARIENEKIRIDYTNNEEGMRQDFIIKQKPAGEGKLKLNLSAETKLKMIVGADALMFNDDNGVDKMKYSALKVWDANGRELRAYFEKNELQITNDKLQIVDNKSQIRNSKSQIETKSQIPNRKGSGLFTIVVNDEDAVYPVTIDPLSTSPNWTAEINQTNAHFGNSVSTAGDVNGDGYSDVIVGAPSYDNGQTNEGRAYVYHGSATGLPVTPIWTAESNQAESDFGNSVSTAGDVNGDGYSDVIVGAFVYGNGQTDEGRAYVYHGSATGLSATAIWTAESDQEYAQFGLSVSTAGDVNGDGYSDVIVGAPYFDNGQTNEGRAYVYHGSPSGLLGTASWNAESDQLYAGFGLSVSTAGDVNGDGYSDVIVGANNFDNGQTDEGRAYVYHGSATGLPVTPIWTAESDQQDADFGLSVSTAGDVNGDGYSDVILGAFLYNNGQADEGRAFVYHGSASGLQTTANWTAESNQEESHFGLSVSTAGDVNGDGYSDVIVGAFRFDNGQADEGRAYVYHGSASGLSASENWTAESDQVDAHFGVSVSTAGDVNGDGYSDVIVGAPHYDNGQTDEGRAFVYHGSASGLSALALWTAESDKANAYFGASVSTAGDVNGDGYSDVIVGAPGYDNGQTYEGRAFVYHGSATGLPVTPIWTAESNQASSEFGNSVSTAGDVNGDGYSDVIVGAMSYDNGQRYEGRAYVYHGSATGLSATAIWTAESDQANGQFGRSVSTAGDVNGDGYSDVIVGADAYSNGQTAEGRAYVYHGSPSGLQVTASWNAESNQLYAFFGYSVSTAGDVNGDGYSDVIVGAYDFEYGQIFEGRAFVYHGSATGLSVTPNWTAESNQEESYFGYSVSTAGDVNGDGYSDVIVGALLYDNGHSDEGRAYVYHGSPTGLPATANWTAESNQYDSYFGSSVSTAGDVNGDGYSDVIVGAIYFDNGQANEGRAYVYHGSASGLSASENWTAESDQASAKFGSSVSTAGDVNGDGFSEVIVGAVLFDNGQSNEGRAFVYYGNEGTGLRSTVQQYKPGTSTVVSSGGLTGTDGQARLNIFGRSPFGRADGRIVYEYKDNGVKFSGAIITNSTLSSGSGTNTDLGTSINGVQLNYDISGLLTDKVYKWRARVQYSLVNNPYQKFGPWKYYNNYTPVPLGNFRATDPLGNKQLNLTMFIQGFYDAGSDAMVGDTVMVYLRNSTSPYAVVDLAKAFVSTAGSGTFIFSNAVNGVNYYIQLKHRNSIETWSKTPQTFTGNSLTYNFTTANTQAYGNNMINVDDSPARYAVYSGDINQNGTVDLIDIMSAYLGAISFSSGYVVSDVTGDNIVDQNDIQITYNNSAGFVAVMRP